MRVAVSAVGAAIMFGTSIVTVAVLGVDMLRTGMRPGAEAGVQSAPGADAAALLVGGTFGGFALAAVLAWWLLAPIGSLYRRTALAIASSFGVVVLMLLGMPAHHYFGQPGLACLALLLAFGAAAFGVRARRAGSEP